jgi:hypothetical protein
MPLVGRTAQQQLDQGGLAAAVFADDEQDLAGFDLRFTGPTVNGSMPTVG